MIRAPLLSPLQAALVRPLGRRVLADEYAALRAAALDAAARNNASIWFVEQDLTNIFTNSDGGGTPAVNGVIGLVLPPGRTPGAELFTGGDASTLGTWQNTGGVITLDNGEFRLNTSGAYGGASRVISTVAGRWYECTATYRSGLGNGCNIFLRPGGADVTTDQVQFPTNTSSTPLTVTRYIRATGTQMWVRLTSLLNGGGDVCYFDNLSFREVGGHVLESPTTSQKPTLVRPGATAPNRIGFRFDGADDRLRSARTPLSAEVGDPYTLIFSGQLGILTGPRMAVSDGRGLGMNGDGAAAAAETLHGGTTRWGFGQQWPLNARRVVTATYRRTPNTITQRVGGTQTNSAEINPTSALNPDGFFVGSRRTDGEFWQGDIFLACAAPGVMPLTDIRAIEQFAAFIGDAPYV